MPFGHELPPPPPAPSPAAAGWESWGGRPAQHRGGQAEAPATSVAVVKHLSELTLRLRQLTDMYAASEQDAARKRSAADDCESRAFLNADGAMELRKHTARVAAHRLEEEALVAEALVRVLKAKLRAIETSIEVGRTYGATVRAEFKTMGYGGEGA